MRILGIETSCDETAIGILKVQGKKTPRFEILANVVSSQTEIHRPYGGVYPSLAKREHEKNLPLVLKRALKKAGIKKLQPKEVGVIAVTQGPGLDPCLWAGVNFAKNLAKATKIPLVPIDHMEGHLLVGLFLQSNEKSEARNSKQILNTKYQILNTKNIFPAVSLLVSGGHTQLILVRGIGRYQLLGETRDDAAGECFDKTARILGLPYPGGPAVAAQAALADQNQKYNSQVNLIRLSYPQLNPIKLPRPMIYSKDYDFSFSGLKTAVLYDYQSRSEKVRKSKAYVRAMAREIQQAIIDVLAAKTIRAAQEYDAKILVLGGGVAANQELRRQLKIKNVKLKIAVAPPQLCTDNGLMPALAGFFNLSKKKQGAALNRIAAKPNLRLE